MSRAVVLPPVDVLVVDDSAVVRRALKAIIEAEGHYRVHVATDPYDAVEVMRKIIPGVVVLDVDMPRMDGLTFLKKLMRQHPLPVILVTDHPERGVAALEFGAMEVIKKPEWDDPEGLEAWAFGLRESLRQVVARAEPRAAEELRVAATPRHEADAVLVRRPFQPRGAPLQKVVAIGASTGGVAAITRLLGLLPADLPGIVIVQHMPGGFTAAFASRLNNDPSIALEVREAKSNDPIRPGTALIVPGHAHGAIRRASSHYWIELLDGPPVCRHRPSVEVLFRSAAQTAGPRGAGVILTGMGDDGARGLLEIHEAGGTTIAQDEASCVVFGMPREAIRHGGAKHVLTLDKIAASLVAWAKGG